MRLEDGSGVFFELRRAGDRVRVSASTGWCTAAFEERLTDEEIQDLADRLQTLAAEGAGSFTFEAFYNWLRLTFAMAKKDELHVSVTLQSAPDYLNELRLFLNLPQNSLPAIAESVRNL